MNDSKLTLNLNRLFFRFVKVVALKGHPIIGDVAGCNAPISLQNRI